jgi:hypothetical protein
MTDGDGHEGTRRCRPRPPLVWKHTAGVPVRLGRAQGACLCGVIQRFKRDHCVGTLPLPPSAQQTRAGVS